MESQLHWCQPLGKAELYKGEIQFICALNSCPGRTKSHFSYLTSALINKQQKTWKSGISEIPQGKREGNNVAGKHCWKCGTEKCCSLGRKSTTGTERGKSNKNWRGREWILSQRAALGFGNLGIVPRFAVAAPGSLTVPSLDIGTVGGGPAHPGVTLGGI